MKWQDWDGSEYYTLTVTEDMIPEEILLCIYEQYGKGTSLRRNRDGG